VAICRIKGLSCLIFTEDIIYQHAIKITSISSIFKISLFPKFTINARAGLCFFIKLKSDLDTIGFLIKKYLISIRV